MNIIKRSLDSHNPYNNKEFKGLHRVLSSANIQRHEHMKNTLFPTLKNNSSSMAIIAKKPLNNSTNKKNHYKIEIEKLYDQNVHYKKAIKKLEAEINEVKNELDKKQKILSEVNSEIEQLIQDNKEGIEFNVEENKLNEQWSDQGKYSLIKKMKNKIKEAERGLNEEILKNKILRKDKKFTKFNELEIERKIIMEQSNKIKSLIENSLEVKSNHDKELYQNGIFNNGLESQKNIIYNFMQKFKNLTEEEKRLQNEIAKYEKRIDKTNNRVNIVKLKQISLQNQNKKLIIEREEFKSKNKYNTDNIFLLEDLRKKLSEAKSDYKYNKLKHKKTNEKLDNIKKSLHENLEQYKRIEKKDPLVEENNKANYTNINKGNNDEYINKLKEIYQENRDKENELEKYLFLYQEAIQKMSNGENINIEDIRNNILRIINKVDMDNKASTLNMDFILSENNPYFVNNEENEPLKTGKFTNEQFGQFTYIVFKNFEAKKIDYSKAQNDIISPLINFYKDNKSNPDGNDIQEKISSKFAEIILNVLNINNQKDNFMLKLYFNAIYFDQMISSEEISDTADKIDVISQYFLSLFNYIHLYDEKEESDIKKRLKSKYNSQLVKLKTLIKEYIAKKKSEEGNKYISIKEIKDILDNNSDIKLRGKYIEFIIYYMKQFDDKNSTLLDLNVEKIEDILKEPLENAADNNNNDGNVSNVSESNESGEEVSPSVFNKNIHDVLLIIKQIMDNENKTMREIFSDSIVKITKPNADIITLDSFADEINKRKIKLNYLQMSCFNYRYCINEDLHALDINKIEQDLNDFKEDEIYQYHS